MYAMLRTYARIILMSTALSVAAAACSTQKIDNHNDMEQERLTYFSFDQHNSMAIFNGEKYNVRALPDGRVHVVIDEGFPGEKEFYLSDSTLFDGLLDIVATYNTDRYRSQYMPRMAITDGDSWSLYYTYASGRSVSSGGYMEWPDNYREMRRALRELFRPLRERQEGMLTLDCLRFTCRDSQGCDIEYSIERGAAEATVTLHDARRGVDDTLHVGNDRLDELQQLANTVSLRSRMYDYVTDNPEATRCTYYVRYNTGDTYEGVTCHTQYPSQKVSAIMHFFSQWMPKQ